MVVSQVLCSRSRNKNLEIHRITHETHVLVRELFHQRISMYVFLCYRIPDQSRRKILRKMVPLAQSISWVRRCLVSGCWEDGCLQHQISGNLYWKRVVEPWDSLKGILSKKYRDYNYFYFWNAVNEKTVISIHTVEVIPIFILWLYLYMAAQFPVSPHRLYFNQGGSWRVIVKTVYSVFNTKTVSNYC